MAYSYYRRRKKLLKGVQDLILVLSRVKDVRVRITRRTFSRICYCIPSYGFRRIDFKIQITYRDSNCNEDLAITCVEAISGSYPHFGKIITLIMIISSVIFGGLSAVLQQFFSSGLAQAIAAVVTLSALAPELLLFERRRTLNDKVREEYRMLKASDNLCRSSYELVAELIRIIRRSRESKGIIESKEVLEALKAKFPTLVNLGLSRSLAPVE